MSQPAIYCVEGNIGSGKSTLVDQLRSVTHMGGRPVVYVEEPVPVWESIVDDSGKNMIELFYGDQNKYAFSFQMMAYISRLAILQDTCRLYPNSIIICERSLFTDYYVFAKMLHESGQLSLEEYTIYRKWFHHFIKGIRITGIIYIDTTPTTAHNRCKKRARAGEDIGLAYLTKCNDAHDAWISATDVPVVRIDGNTSHSPQQYAEWMATVTRFVVSHEEPYTLWLSVRMLVAYLLVRALAAVSASITK